MENNKKHIPVLEAAWKLGLFLIGIAALCFGIAMIIEYYQDHHGKWITKIITNSVAVEEYYDNSVRVLDLKTRTYTTPKIKWVSGVPEHDDSLTVFCDMDGQRGYLNVYTGQIVLPPRYPAAWIFSEGLGAILNDDRDKVGFIDGSGNLAIDYVVPYTCRYNYLFKDGFCIAKVREEDRWRYFVYGRDGCLVFENSFTHMEGPDEDGYRILANEDGYWLYDRYFNKVLPDTYENLQFAGGKKGVYASKDHVKQLVDFDGKIKQPFVVDSTYRLYLSNNSLCNRYPIPNIAVYLVDDWAGLIDIRTGEIITPAIYRSFCALSKDLLLAKTDDSGACVILDKRGSAIN